MTTEVSALLRRRLGGVYRDPARVFRDATKLLSSPVGSNLLLSASPLYENTGDETPPVLVFSGTVSMSYKGGANNIPVDIYLPPPYPARPPVCFVRPTKGMMIKENHRHVAPDGMVYMPYLHEWRPHNTHNLVEMVVIMSSLFESSPPVFAKPAGSSNVTHGESEFIQLVERLAANDPSLTMVDFQSKNIGNAEGTRLFEALRDNTRVTSIRLKWNNIGAEGASMLAEVLLRNSSVILLSLGGNNIGNAGVRELAMALTSNSSITELSLGANMIGDLGAEALADALTLNSSLNSLSLYQNNIGDVGAGALAKSLFRNCSVAMIDLRGNNIGNEGATTFAEVLEHNSSVTSLYLKENNISHDIEEKISQLVQFNREATSPEEASFWQKVARFGLPASGQRSNKGPQPVEAGQTAGIQVGPSQPEGTKPTGGQSEQDWIGRDHAKKLERAELPKLGATAGLGFNRSEQLQSYLNDATLKPSTRRVSKDDSTYDTVFQTITGDALILRVHLPSQSAAPPTMQLVGIRATHAWLDSLMRVTGYQPITSEHSWSSSGIKLGSAVNTVIQHFQLNPPSLIEITDASLKRIQNRISQQAGEENNNGLKHFQVPQNPSRRILLTSQEYEAVHVLAQSLGDFERSLESVRGLPRSLRGIPQNGEAYFQMFTASFERTYVAAQALSTGTVRGDLSGAKSNMLCAVLHCIGWSADQTSIPFVGCLSILATLFSHRQQSQQNDMLWVFQDFFRGNSRDHYLLTYRRIAEEICLRMDWSGFERSRFVETAATKSRIQKLLDLVQRQLQSAHPLAIQDLQPMALKVMDDLAALTRGVLNLWTEESSRFDALKNGDEGEKALFALSTLGIAAAKPSRQHWGSVPATEQRSGMVAKTGLESIEPAQSDSQNLRNASQFRAESARYRTLEQELHQVKDVLQEAGQSSRGRSEAARVRELEKQLRNLARKLEQLDPGLSSVDVRSDGGQAQALCLRSKNSRAAGAVDQDHGREQDRIIQELHEMNIEMQKELFRLQGRVDELVFSQFVTNRVLNLREALCLTKHILQCSRKGVQVDRDGCFVLDGTKFKVGIVPGKLGKVMLWDRSSAINISQDWNGTKSVKYWFEANGLGRYYEAHIKTAVRNLFACELEMLSVPEEATTQSLDDSADCTRVLHISHIPSQCLRSLRGAERTRNHQKHIDL